jgi:sugar phosphate isomerase/epimerase
MAKFGCCAPLEKIDDLAAWGFDYIEPPTVTVAPQAGEDEFRKALAAAESRPISPEAFNCFVPGEVKLIGPDVDMDRVSEYVETALQRCAKIGAKTIVVGSGAARLRPDDFPEDRADAQLADFFNLAAGVAQLHGLTIAIEHLNRSETNTLNKIEQCFGLARRLNRPNLGLIVDLWHVECEDESFGSLVGLGEYVRHVHVADTGRKAPGTGDFDIGGFFDALKEAGYDGRISIECEWDDFDAEAPKALEFLKARWG